MLHTGITASAQNTIVLFHILFTSGAYHLEKLKHFFLVETGYSSGRTPKK